jgi:hypothetical protein
MLESNYHKIERILNQTLKLRKHWWLLANLTSKIWWSGHKKRLEDLKDKHMMFVMKTIIRCVT